MTLKELKERIDQEIEMNPIWEDLRVCIPNNSGGIGGTSVTDVKFIGRGIDWDSSKFIIFPEKDMCEIGKKPIRFD